MQQSIDQNFTTVQRSVPCNSPVASILQQSICQHHARTKNVCNAAVHRSEFCYCPEVSAMQQSSGQYHATVHLSVSCRVVSVLWQSIGQCHRPAQKRRATVHAEVSVMQQAKGQYYSIFQAILMPQSRCHCHAKQARCPEVSVMQQTNGQNYSHATVQMALSCKTDHMSRGQCHPTDFFS
jgi:hypothetical protein